MYEIIFSSRKKTFFFTKYIFETFFLTPLLAQGRARKGFSHFGQILTILVKYRYVALLYQKSRLGTAWSGTPAVELGIKTFLKMYLNNICNAKKCFRASEAMKTEIPSGVFPIFSKMTDF